MKNLRNIFTIMVFGLFVFAACEKNEDQLFSEPSHVAFQNAAATAYIVEESPRYQVPLMMVGPHSSQSYQVTFAIKATHGTATTDVTEGNQIATLNKTVTIPANTSLVSFPVDINFDNMDAGKMYTLILELVDGGGLEISSGLNPVFVLRMQKYSPMVPEDFVGIFDASEYSHFDLVAYDYQVEIELLEVTQGGKVAKYVVHNLWPWTSLERPGIEFTLDDRDPSKPLLIMPTQNFFFHATYGQSRWRTTLDGSFDASSTTLFLPRAQIAVDAGLFDDVTITLTKATSKSDKGVSPRTLTIR